MENPKLVELANEFFEQAKALEPAVKKVVIYYEGDESEVNDTNKKMFSRNPELFANKLAACVYVPGIGVVCF